MKKNRQKLTMTILSLQGNEQTNGNLHYRKVLICSNQENKNLLTFSSIPKFITAYMNKFSSLCYTSLQYYSFQMIIVAKEQSLITATHKYQFNPHCRFITKYKILIIKMLTFSNVFTFESKIGVLICFIIDCLSQCALHINDCTLQNNAFTGCRKTLTCSTLSYMWSRFLFIFLPFIFKKTTNSVAHVAEHYF